MTIVSMSPLEPTTPPMANGLLDRARTEPGMLLHPSVDIASTFAHLALRLVVAESEIRAASTESEDDEERFWNLRDRAADHYRPYRVRDGVLTIPISGVLISGADYMIAPYFTGYGYLARAVARGAADPAVHTILFAVDSPGGMVTGCAAVGEAIYAARSAKRLVAHAGDSCYSAAYWLASGAHEIVVSPTGGAGSIGVLTSHLDYSAAYEKWGVTKTYLFAGAHKVDEWAENAPLSDDARARILARIGRIYDVFVATVARNRSMTEDAVRATEALVYPAIDAVQIGLADRIGLLSAEPMAAEAANPDQEDPMAQSTQASTTTPTPEQTAAAAQPAISAADLDRAAQAAAQAAATAERDRISAILNHELAATRPAAARQAAFTLGLDADKAAAFLAAMPEERATVDQSGAAVIGALDAAGGSQVRAGVKATSEDDDAAVIDGIFALRGRGRRR